MCLLGVITIKNFIWGVMPQTPPPQIEAGIGISSLNVESNNFRTAGPILVIRSSNDAVPRTKFGFKGQNLKVDVLGVINKKLPKGSFPAKILHCIAFERRNRFMQTVTRLMHLGKQSVTQT
jgi:hypothetical protein